MHISQTTSRTAADLAHANLDPDPYHQVIREAAQHMTEAGLGKAHYGGQWSSGSTWWTLDGRNYTVERIAQT